MVELIIAGLARSGKDTVGDYLAEDYGFEKHTFSEVLRELLISEGIQPTKERMIELGDELRKEMGMDAVAKLLAPKIKRKRGIALVGPRSIEEIEFFREKFPGIIVVKVSSSEQQRIERNKEEGSAEKDKFFERDNKDMKRKGFEKVLEAAQYELENFSTKEELYSQIDFLMEKLGQRKNRI